MFAHAWRILCLLVYYLTIPFISVTGAWIIWDQGRVTSECIRSAPDKIEPSVRFIIHPLDKIEP